MDHGALFAGTVLADNGDRDRRRFLFSETWMSTLIRAIVDDDLHKIFAG